MGGWRAWKLGQVESQHYRWKVEGPSTYNVGFCGCLDRQAAMEWEIILPLPPVLPTDILVGLLLLLLRTPCGSVRECMSLLLLLLCATK